MPKGQRILWLVGLWAALLILMTGTAWAQTSYVVQPGDTLNKIARQWNTTVADIVAANGITNPNLIYVGQMIMIPGGAVPPTAPPPSAPPPTGTTYVVQPGDTLYRVAVRFGITVQAVAAANNIQNVNFITVGQVLVIPGGGGNGPPANPLPPPVPTNPPPAAGPDLLLNGSFEGGWYHPGNVPELQIPANWVFEWDEGPTGFGNAPWDVWVRPEVRVLPAAYLPPHEHDLFIFEGAQTVKAFKGNGAISYRLYQDVTLTPGSYTLKIGVFPDLVTAYVNGQKIRPSDPAAGEVRFMVGSGGSGWLSPVIGQKNVLAHTFTIASTQTVRIGVGVRGKYAFENNGWFLDAWSLTRVQ